MTLTDEQCEQFRMLPLDFDDTMRAAYKAGLKQGMEESAKICTQIGGNIRTMIDGDDCARAIRQAAKEIK